ncbi:MAG: mechanosensitive ion channel family protein [Desulfohalobiaceae bacterium]
MDSELWKTFLAWLVTNGLQILLILALAYFGLRILRSAIARSYRRYGKDKDEEQQKRLDTLSAVSLMAATVFVAAVAMVVVLGELGVALGPILTAAGVLGLAVGFGAQHLVQDVINGFFLLLDDQIRVGDVVTIGGKGGLVERVTLRLTVLRDLHGNVHFIRNGQIDIVTNMTKEYSRYVFDVGVAYRENVDEVIEVIKEVDEDMRNDEEFGSSILEPIEILGLDRFDDSAVVVRARTKTKPIKQWEVGREFNRRLKKRFDELDIEIPFPHQTIYFGVDKQGQAPPLRMVKEEEE